MSRPKYTITNNVDFVSRVQFVSMAAVNLDENDLSAVRKLLLDSGYTPMVT
jgi:hypothetical protein